MKKLIGISVLLLLLAACSSPEKPEVANLTGLWKDIDVTVEACNKEFLVDRITFDIAQNATDLTANVRAETEVIGGIAVSTGTFAGSIDSDGHVTGITTITDVPEGDRPEPPLKISTDLQLVDNQLKGTMLNPGGAYCLGGKWEDAVYTITLTKQ